VVDFLRAVVFFRPPVVLREVRFRAVVFLPAVDFLRAVVFFRPVVFRVVRLRVVVLRAAVFLLVVFRAGLLRVVFLAVVFLLLRVAMVPPFVPAEAHSYPGGPSAG
jgi:hypothetical protein